MSEFQSLLSWICLLRQGLLLVLPRQERCSDRSVPPLGKTADLNAYLPCRGNNWPPGFFGRTPGSPAGRAGDTYTSELPWWPAPSGATARSASCSPSGEYSAYQGAVSAKPLLPTTTRSPVAGWANSPLIGVGTGPTAPHSRQRGGERRPLCHSTYRSSSATRSSTGAPLETNA